METIFMKIINILWCKKTLNCILYRVIIVCDHQTIVFK